MPVVEIIAAVIQLLLKLTGGHEEARKAITQDEIKAANAAANAVAAARILAENVKP